MIVRVVSVEKHDNQWHITCRPPKAPNGEEYGTTDFIMVMRVEPIVQVGAVYRIEEIWPQELEQFKAFSQ